MSATTVLGLSVVAACTNGSSSSSGPASSGTATGPITIGASLSLTGDFSADGQAFKRGYLLGQENVNAQGGIFGRPVKLDIIDDASSPSQVVTNYQTLFGQDRVDLGFGPFSSLLTSPASTMAARFGTALAGGWVERGWVEH